MTTNLLSVIEQLVGALEEWERVDVLGREPHIHRESWKQFVQDRNTEHTAAIAAGQQALEQYQLALDCAVAAGQAAALAKLRAGVELPEPFAHAAYKEHPSYEGVGDVVYYHPNANIDEFAAMPVGELPAPFHPSASHINPDYRDGWNAALAATQSAGVPVGELTLEQITRIYDRYGGDMVNCTRAIERELAAARSQPTTEESSVVAGAQPVREPLSEDRIYEITGTQQRDAMMRTMAVNIARWVEQEHGITKKGEQ